MAHALVFDASCLDRLDAVLSRVGFVAQQRVMQEAVRSEAERFRETWKSLLPPNGAPNSTPVRGVLKKTLRVKMVWMDRDNTILAYVRPDKRGSHLHLVELGHEIVTHKVRTGKRTRAPSPSYRDQADTQTVAGRGEALIATAERLVVELLEE